jgi:hypothetical protein
LLTLFIASAFAAPPTWSWAPEVTHRYVVQMRTETPYVMWLLEDRNGAARVASVALAADLRCSLEDTLKPGKGWLVVCDVGEASFFAVAVAQDVGRAQEAVGHYDRLLEDTKVHFKLTPDGAVSQLRLAEPEDRSERSFYIHQMLERYMELAMSPLDVQLPPIDMRAGEGWMQRNFKPGEMPTRETAAGSVKVQQQLVSDSPTATVLQGGAEGGITVLIDNWRVSARSDTTFDRSLGAITKSTWSLTSKPGSNTIEQNTVPYRLWAEVQRFGPDDVVTFKPSTEW